MDFRLFISHSSPGEESRQRLRELAQAIETASRPDTPIQVLMDLEQIYGGEDWRRRISFMLHYCHGAIVLVDEAALASSWVLAEAAFLSFRHLADTQFPFVPVSFLDMDGLKRAIRDRTAQAQARGSTPWDVVRLTDTQYVLSQTPEAIAARLVKGLRARGVLSPMATPADRLADQLAPKFADAGRMALRELAGELDDLGAYIDAGGDQERAALAVVRRMLQTRRLTAVLEQMDGLGSAFPAARRQEIIDELAPLPLPEDAAAMLTRRRASGAYAHASLCTEQPSFTVPLYVRRAHLARQPPRSFEIPNTYGTVADLRTHLREEYRSRIGRALTDTQVDERLNAAAQDLYVWVPGPVDVQVLTELEQAYPRIAFIIHHQTGAEPPVLPAGVLPVTPPLEPGEENQIWVDSDIAAGQLAC